jgi:hypothetical protein
MSGAFRADLVGCQLTRMGLGANHERRLAASLRIDD